MKAYSNDVFDLIRAYDMYAETLETYLTELDETFDKILEEAKKMAEQQIKERSRKKSPKPQQTKK